jgi:hypothetical protein
MSLLLRPICSQPAPANSLRLGLQTRWTSNLPQNTDLLERYRGLVAVGQIEYDEEQVRVVMEVLSSRENAYKHALISYLISYANSTDG